MTLYHYACEHTRRALGRRGMLRPTPSVIGVPLLWLTDQDPPDRNGLGLTRHLVGCDRLAFRYLVTDPDAVPWLLSPHRTPAAVMLLELLPEGADPRRWFVLTHAALGILDRAYRPPAS